jgi:hypothetical protein
VKPSRAKFSYALQTIHAGHIDVQHHEVKSGGGTKYLQSLVSVTRFFATQADLLQQPAQMLTDETGIIYDQRSYFWLPVLSRFEATDMECSRRVYWWLVNRHLLVWFIHCFLIGQSCRKHEYGNLRVAGWPALAFD